MNRVAANSMRMRRCLILEPCSAVERLSGDQARTRKMMKRLRLMTTMVLPMALAFACQIGAQAQTTRSTASSAITLRQDMRKLWTDHTVWTRDYIMAAVGDQPDAP